MSEYFTNIAGNDALRKRLAREILSGSLPHAFIIEGHTGSGRRTLALNIAAALSCEARDGEAFPCLECAACRKILEAKTPDVIRITNDRDKVGIGVDSARFIRSDALTVPNDFEHKVYIIENADLMTVQAQNAMLLTLEEPHSYAVFILVCSSASSLLETVRSRAPVMRTEPLSDETLTQYLRSRDKRAAALLSSSEEREAFLAAADGCIGKALTLLDPKERKPGNDRNSLAERCVKLLIFSQPASERLALLSEFPTKREDAVFVLAVVITALRDLILLKKSENVPLCFFGNRETALELSCSVTMSKLIALYERVERASDSLMRNANLRLTLTVMLETAHTTGSYKKVSII